jgi:hypothetical protein
VRTHVVSLLVGSPVNAAAAHRLASDIAQGSGAAGGLAALPPQARPAAIHAVRTAFVTGLNEVFLIGAILSLVAAVLTLVLIRSRDFESSAARSGTAPQQQQQAAGVGAGAG